MATSPLAAVHCLIYVKGLETPSENPIEDLANINPIEKNPKENNFVNQLEFTYAKKSSAVMVRRYYQKSINFFDGL